MKLIMEQLKAIDDMQVNSTNKLNTTWDLSAPTHASIHFDLHIKQGIGNWIDILQDEL